MLTNSVGIVCGDSILLTLARRLTRILKSHDTLARLARRSIRPDPAVEQDLSAASPPSPKPSQGPSALRDRLQRPEIFLTASIGLARCPIAQTGSYATRSSVLPSLRCIDSKRESAATASSLQARDRQRQDRPADAGNPNIRRAIEAPGNRHPLRPWASEDRSIAGFEALARWDHPNSGGCRDEFITIAEEICLIVDLCTFVLESDGAVSLAIWPPRDAALRRRSRLFAIVNSHSSAIGVLRI